MDLGRDHMFKFHQGKVWGVVFFVVVKGKDLDLTLNKKGSKHIVLKKKKKTLIARDTNLTNLHTTCFKHNNYLVINALNMTGRQYNKSLIKHNT